MSPTSARRVGGGEGICTPEAVARLPDYQSGAFDCSATPVEIL
ncbi:MAG: hypothetical protein V2A73_01295 [Pseudomonadota bacterium]